MGRKWVKNLNEGLGVPSSYIQNLMRHNLNISKEEQEEIAQEYIKTKSQKALDTIIKLYTPQLVKLIYKYKEQIEDINPTISFDDVFNSLVWNIGHFLPTNYKHDKGGLSTFVFLATKFYLVNARRHFGNNFDRKHLNKTTSIDKRLANSSDGEKTLGDTLVDPNANVEKTVEKSRQKQKILTAVKKLPTKEKNIIMIMFGFVDNSDYKDKFGKLTIASVSRALDIPGGEVAKYYRNGLNSLRGTLDSI